MPRPSPANRLDTQPRANLSHLLCTMTTSGGDLTRKWFRRHDLVNGAFYPGGGGPAFALGLDVSDIYSFVTLTGDCTIAVIAGFCPVLITYNERVETHGGSLISLTAQTPIELNDAVAWTHTFDHTPAPPTGNVTYLRDFKLKRLAF